MDKNKGILLAIVSILIIGMVVTIETGRFIGRNPASLYVVESMQMPGTEDSTAEDSGDITGNGERASDELTERSEESTSRESMIAPPAISPLGPVEGSTLGAETDEKLEYYEKLLTDLDIQIQKMRDEPSDSTTYSMKAMAKKELKLWNIEMNMLYEDILNALDDEEKDKLERTQQTWWIARDTRAQEAAKKYSGGSLEGVEYTVSQAESTRTRTYELMEEYIDVLPAKSG